MRIALVSAHCQAVPAETACSEALLPSSLACALAGLGHRVTLYTRCERQDRPRAAILGGRVSIEQIPAGPVRPLRDDELALHMPAFAAHLADRWQAKRPDVVHAFSWTSGLAALGAVRGGGTPVVQTFESLGSTQRRLGGDESVSVGRVRLEAAIGRQVAVVLASSTEEAAELCRLAVPKSSIQVIPYGVDTGLFSPDGKSAAKGARHRLVAVAPADRPLGLQTVVRALAQVNDAELVIAGGPDGRHLPRSGAFREVARLADALGVRSRVKFAGEVTGASLAALLRSADIAVSAAPYEPSGLAAIQAMACGTPVIASAVGAHLDAVIDGTTGLLVAPLNAGLLARQLRRLLATSALLQGYGIAAADRARSRYSWPRIGNETLATYQRLLAAKAAAAAAEDADYRADDDDYAEPDRLVAAFA
ncbi:MAG: glycosyltransferase [Streptosporangiaceae bacterium]